MLKKFILCAVIVPALILPTGCATVEGGGSACGVEADKVHKSTGSPGQMLGKARFGCRGNARRAEIDIRIQVKSGGQWFTANSFRMT